MEYKTYDVAFVFGVIFCKHCWRIFLIWNSNRLWLIKFWSLKIKAKKKYAPKLSPSWTEILRRRKICIYLLTPFNKTLQAIWQSVLIDFHWFTYFDILKNALPIILKSVWWSFKNQRSEMYIFFVFPCWSSGYMPFWPYPSVSGGKLAQKMGRFGFLKKIKNLSKCFAKIHHF